MALSATQLVLQSPVTINFVRNRATSQGGAIFLLDPEDTTEARCRNRALPIIENCFFAIESSESSSVDVHINFEENSARDGPVLFGGFLGNFNVTINNVQVSSNGFQFLQTISTFTPSLYEVNSSIASSPVRFCLCNNGKAECTGSSFTTVRTLPGKCFTLLVIAVGQLNMPVTSRAVAILQGVDTSTELLPLNRNLNRTCTNIAFRLFTRNKIEYFFTYPQECDKQALYVDVQVDSCPNGFNLTNFTTAVNVLVHSFSSLRVLCATLVDTELISPPNAYWMRAILDVNLGNYLGFVWRRNCPGGYCRERNEMDSISLNFSTTDSDSQCTENRTGILCGACKQNYSLTLNNFQCKICENKFLSLILIFGFAGIALIAVLLALHMTVAAGTINGLILYANIVNVHRDIFFPPDDANFNVNPLSIFIAWINLDLGIPTCFYEGLDSYLYTWLQFIFPLYLWLLIGFIIFSSRFSTKIAKLFGSNPIAVLATVILMSFTKLLQTSVGALSFVYLDYSYGMREKVWILDANVTYFQGKHAALAIVAICVIIFLLLPYIFLLTFGYHLQAFSGKKGFIWFNRFKPLLDAYYAPYSKKTRYWTGFLLFIRACLYVSY